MSLFEDLKNYISGLGIDLNSMYINQSNGEYDQLSYLDGDENGNEYTVSLFIAKDGETGLTIAERGLNKVDEQGVVNFVNELNKYYNDAIFYYNRDGNRFGVKRTSYLDNNLDRVINDMVDISLYAKEQSIKIEV